MIDQKNQIRTPHEAERQQWAALPDAAATWRLLDVLDRLEAFHVNLGAASGKPLSSVATVSPGAAITAELAKVRQENLRLRQTQRLAIQRLDDLLTQIPALENAAATAQAIEESGAQMPAADASPLNLRLLAGHAA